jgi:probable addiction module antidote protein
MNMLRNLIIRELGYDVNLYNKTPAYRNERIGAKIRYMDVEVAHEVFSQCMHLTGGSALAQIAKELNLNREGLYTALSPQGNPSFVTIARVLDNLGFQLSIRQKVSA